MVFNFWVFCDFNLELYLFFCVYLISVVGEHPHCTWHFGSESWVARGRRAHPAPRSQDNKHMKLAKFFKAFPFVNSVVDQNHARIRAETRMILSTRLNHGARTVY